MSMSETEGICKRCDIRVIISSWPDGLSLGDRRPRILVGTGNFGQPSE